MPATENRSGPDRRAGSQPSLARRRRRARWVIVAVVAAVVVVVIAVWFGVYAAAH